MIGILTGHIMICGQKVIEAAIPEILVILRSVFKLFPEQERMSQDWKARTSVRSVWLGSTVLVV